MIGQYFASVDMGTNATRLAIGTIDEDKRLETVHTQRYPLRIGSSVFKSSNLSPDNIREACEVFRGIRRILDSFRVKNVRAVATSAMREAKNAKVMVDEIFRCSSIKLEIISGLEEAALVSWAVSEKLNLDDGVHLIADLGAGSLELIKVVGRKPSWMNSYTLGTVVFAGMDCSVLDKSLPEMMDAKLLGIEKNLVGTQSFIAVGGNIEVLSNLLECTTGEDGVRHIETASLSNFINQCKRLTIEEIRYYFGISHERAEVICPAAIINLWLAKKLGCNEIKVPLIGLKEAVLMDIAHTTVQNEAHDL